MAFACIYVPDFPVAALVRAEPELRSQALVVLEGKAPLQTVFAADEDARRAGVSLGMTKLQVEACGGLALRARSLPQETAAHVALLDCAQSFSPRVEDAACDTVILEVDGLEKLFGPPSKIARALSQRTRDLGLQANIAIAGNPDSAALAARGFSGITIIPEGKEAERLGSLPVEILVTEGEPTPEAEQILETFYRWGIRNLRDLAALPEVGVSERLGQAGIRLQKLARGATSRTLAPVEEPLVFEESAELEHPLMLLEPLALLLERLLEQLCARLKARALATQELRLEMELENGWSEERMLASHVLRSCSKQDRGAGTRPDPSPRAENALAQNDKFSLFQRTLQLPVPLLDSKTFLKLLQLDLKAHPPGAPIRKVRLSAEPAKPRPAQNGLFLPPAPEPEKLELTLAKIAGIVGENKAGTPELLDTHRREGFCMQHFSPGELQLHGGSNGKFSPTSSKHQIPRVARNHNSGEGSASDPVTALRIFRPSLEVAVTMRTGKPGAIVCPKRKELEGEVLWAAGPWRSSGDWWEQEGWARDEWDIAVQAEAGIAFYRLVRDLLNGWWFLEGNYD